MPVDLLLLKSAAVQLAGESLQFSLDDAEASLREAVDLDPGNVQARLELAHFLFSVRDDAQSASPLFEAAEQDAREAYAATVSGRARLIAEVAGTQAAIEHLERSPVLDEDQVQALLREFRADIAA